MISSLSFGQKSNINNTVQAKPQSLKSSAVLRSQPHRDEVSFRGLNIEKSRQSLMKIGFYEKLSLSEITPITIFDAQKKPFEAYMTKTLVGKNIGLAVFTPDGELLGDIRHLDKDEHLTHRIYGNDIGRYIHIGNYLRLHDLNTSYIPGYKGVGSALIQAAKKESEKLGFDGQLKVVAFNCMSKNHGSPVPFYAKMGFTMLGESHLSKDELIEKYKDITPPNVMLLLTTENLKRLKQYKLNASNFSLRKTYPQKPSLFRHILNFFTQ